MIGGEIYDRQRGIHAHPIINRDFVTGASCGLRSMELAAECSRSFFPSIRKQLNSFYPVVFLLFAQEAFTYTCVTIPC